LYASSCACTTTTGESRIELLPVPRFELADHAFQRHATRAQQDQGVEEQVRGFLDHFLLAVVHAGQRQLDTFLADLLRHA
jgi:hypothetical protein